MEKQSVAIGVDRLVIALLTSDTSSGVVYGTPEEIKGVSEIGLTINNSRGVFYADDGSYETYEQQGDIDALISLAGLSAEKRAEYTGASYSSANGAAVDGKSDNPPYVAIGFRTQKANTKYRYVWLLKGQLSKPNRTNQTKGSTTNPQPEQYNFKALHREYDGNWRRTLDSDDANCPTGLTDALLYNITTGWFSNPDYVPVAPGTAIADLAASSGTGSGEIDLTFSAATSATSVKVQVNDAALGSTWIDATTSAALDATSTTATVTGLTAGNTYNLRLVVVGGTKNGISNTASAAAGTGA